MAFRQRCIKNIILILIYSYAIKCIITLPFAIRISYHNDGLRFISHHCRFQKNNNLSESHYHWLVLSDDNPTLHLLFHSGRI